MGPAGLFGGLINKRTDGSTLNCSISDLELYLCIYGWSNNNRPMIVQIAVPIPENTKYAVEGSLVAFQPWVTLQKVLGLMVANKAVPVQNAIKIVIAMEMAFISGGTTSIPPSICEDAMLLS